MEGIGNTTVEKVAGLALLSRDWNKPYRHKSTGNHISLGDTWFNDKIGLCVSGGGSTQCFPSYGFMNTKVRLVLSVRRGTLHPSVLENMKISTREKGQLTHNCWCDLEKPQSETKMCTPSYSHSHVTWLALLPSLAQQDYKFGLLLPKSRSLCTMTRPQSFILTQKKSF